MAVRLSYRGKQVKRLTERGLEKLCPVCITWKPQDDTHFSFIFTRGHYHSECRSCQAAAQVLRRFQNRRSA